MLKKIVAFTGALLLFSLSGLVVAGPPDFRPLGKQELEENKPPPRKQEICHCEVVINEETQEQETVCNTINVPYHAVAYPHMALHDDDSDVACPTEEPEPGLPPEPI